MGVAIRFDSVSKRYRLRHGRPRSLRDAFFQAFGRREAAIAASKDQLWALRDVSFEIRPGETVGLIGANGAGKSTALKLISGVSIPNSGQIGVKGRIGALLELGAGFHPELSGRDNIYLNGALTGMGRAEMRRKFDAIVAFSELDKFIDMPVKHYSSGMFARLAFAVNIHVDPDILLVDEVLAVGDVDFQLKCLGRIAELKQAGITICIVTHSLDITQKICTRAIWLDRGQMMVDDVPDVAAARYLAHIHRGDSLTHTADLRPEQRWGNRRIEIRQVRLTDEAGNDKPVFETGEPWVLQMDYMAHGPTLKPVFGMAIFREDGVHVTGPNTGFQGMEIPVLEGPGTIRYCIPNLPLLTGKYLVTVAVHSLNALEMYDYHDRTYQFRVVGSSRGLHERYGLMTMGGEWSFPGHSVPAELGIEKEGGN
jgi:lipopolysaccharide transport system ATP-binding protein